MKRLLPLLFLLISTHGVANEMLTELGLAWGDSRQALTDKAFTLENCTEVNNITSCEVNSTAGSEQTPVTYILFFEHDVGLQRVEMPIRYITADASGTQGKFFYSKLKTYLSKKYDQPITHEYTGRKLYGGYDEFYKCLQYEGCGSWAAFWRLKNGDYAYIALVGVDQGSGYLILFYESETWQEIVNNYKSS